MDNLINSVRACKFLDISKPTLLTLINTNSLPAYRIGNKCNFKQAELEGWIQTRKEANQKEG